MNSVQIYDNESFVPKVFNAWASKADELYEIQKKIKELQKQELALATALKNIQSFQTFSYAGIKYYIEKRLGNIDYGAIPELKSINLELYRKPPISVWKLVIEKRVILNEK